MGETEDEEAPEVPETGKDGPFAWLSGGTAFVKALAGLIGAVTVLVGGLVAAGILGGDSGASTTDGSTSTRPTTQPGNDFSDPPGLFQAVTRPNGRAYFEDAAMVMTALQPARPFVHLAEIEAQRDVVVKLSTRWLSGARDYGVGVLCRYQGAGTYYLLAVLSDGRFNVVRYRGGEGRSLTGGIKRSSAVDDENDIEARCVGDSTTILTLTVNGTRVARVRDEDALESGSVGLRVGSGEARITCRFERFELDSI
jgi:hypothetical protein